jgi:WD40 repeat protein
MHHSDTAYGVVVSPSGDRVFVTGVAYTSGYNATATTIAYDAQTGAQLWLSEYQGPGEYSYAYSIGVDPGGSRVYVTGGANGTCTTMAYDVDTGAQLWLSQPINSTCTALVVSADGSRVYATGQDGYHWHTVSLDSVSGALEWTTQRVGGYPTAPYGLSLSPAGDRLFVTGYTYSGYDDDGVTVAYATADGVPLWTATYDGAGNEDFLRAIAVSTDGSRVFVAGSTAPIYQYTDYLVIAYDAATGAQDWLQEYDGSGGYDTARAVVTGVDGRLVYVTGDSAAPTAPSDYATVAYDEATGDQAWVATYDGPAHDIDIPTAMAIGPTGSRVYVTGESKGVRDKFDYGTVAYNAGTGQRVWVLRFDGAEEHGRDLAKAIAVSPSGRSVFVTGTSEGTGTIGDFLTQARIA